MRIREVTESPFSMRAGENLTLAVNVTGPTGTAKSPSSPSITVHDETNDADVTSTVMPSGSASVSTNKITFPELTALVKDTRYRIDIVFIESGNDWKGQLVVNAYE